MAQLTALEKSSLPNANNEAAAVRTDAVYVVFTTVEDTLAAARVAAGFAGAMAVPLTVVHFRVVPHPLAVDAPVGMSPVETDWFIARLKAEGVNVHVRVILCRDTPGLLAMAFKPHSLVILAGRRSWWPTRAERWRRCLENGGHLVVFVDRAKHRVSEDKTHA